MTGTITLGDIRIDVVRKNIKNLHLSVYPPAGRVRISAPARMSLDTIRVFAIAKLAWIRQQQRKLREQERETPREYINRESHFLWGRRYLLDVIEHDAPPQVLCLPRRLVLYVRPGSDLARRQELMEGWYRRQVREAAAPLVERWAKALGVPLPKVFVRQMKTRWGSCHPASRSIRLNTELAKKPADCLEYIVVHELAHFREPTHGERFVRLMDRVLPQWRASRDRLNRLPVRHEQWGY